METNISIKRQVVLPGPIRRELGLRIGDSLGVKVERGHIVLTPRTKRSRSVRILVDPITGLPVLSAGPDAAKLSSEQVSRLSSEFA
jgi:AbrB family looped-hinge helix DNA binding protein